MTRYTNRNGDSGVVAYEIGSDYIFVQFKGGSVYRYSHARAGRDHVNSMKALARQGSGLNSYINRRVKKLYD